ncbi:hypothetical protein [Roseomonas sp. CECT 9278]|uniref:hypothetical protein n=1 Tax=Roseomonas sp. CECT 9278 TaxID=2845823 RepID=UPI001E486239|nr:hypothetical protein [Roseomonas sp. CECT 9278]CAH0272172.1 hypothetical protein ROS9278_03697 [Roseomonas sp. CECT 9278]
MSLLPRAAMAVLLMGGLVACDQRGNPTSNVEPVRAVDRAAGTNASGAYPSQSDGTRANPPGTAAGRAIDRAAGTNMSGAYPSQSDGTRANPAGTAAERAAGSNPPTRRNPNNPGL